MSDQQNSVWKSAIMRSPAVGWAAFAVVVMAVVAGAFVFG
jgi:hypothetical protein